MEKIVDCGADWFRYTVPLINTNWQKLQEVALSLQDLQATAGNDWEEAKRLQFQGVKCGKVYFGKSESHALFEASGNAAKAATKLVKSERIPGKCCRLDLQTTVDYGEEETDINSRFAAAIKADRALQGMGRGVSLNQFANRDRDTGITAYARSTSRYFRFYHANSGGHRELPVSCYRGEVEYKNEKSPFVWSMFCAAASDEAFAVSTVIAEMLKLGLSENWFHSEIPATLVSVPDTRSDEKTLEWIRTQCLPAMMKMVGKGHEETIEAMYRVALREQRRKELLSASLERVNLREKFYGTRSQ